MIIGCIDVETANGNNNVIEMGVALFCTTTKMVIAEAGCFVKGLNGENVPPFNPAEWCHRINSTAVERYGVPLAKRSPGTLDRIKISDFIDRVAPHFKSYDIAYWTAHNKSFELRYIDFEGARVFCTWRDVELCPELKHDSRKLGDIAAYHDVPLFGAHRALADARTVAHILAKVPIEAMLGVQPEQVEIFKVPEPKGTLHEWIAPKEASPCPDGFNWENGWLGYVEREKNKPLDHGGYPLLRVKEEERQRCIATGSGTYDARKVLKGWGFVWDVNKRHWHRTLAAGAKDYLQDVIQKESGQKIILVLDGKTLPR